MWQVELIFMLMNWTFGVLGVPARTTYKKRFDPINYGILSFHQLSGGGALIDRLIEIGHQ